MIFLLERSPRQPLGKVEPNLCEKKSLYSIIYNI